MTTPEGDSRRPTASEIGASAQEEIARIEADGYELTPEERRILLARYALQIAPPSFSTFARPDSMERLAIKLEKEKRRGTET